MKTHELKDIQLYEENGNYYLRLKYLCEDDTSIFEMEIPKVDIRFNKTVYPNLSYSKYSEREDCTLNTFGGPLKVYPGETSEANHVFYTIKTLEEKHIELTVSEIEKRLGYKIKIVSEDKKESKNDCSRSY